MLGEDVKTPLSSGPVVHQKSMVFLEVFSFQACLGGSMLKELKKCPAAVTSTFRWAVITAAGWQLALLGF
jgi:hypothetical protein